MRARRTSSKLVGLVVGLLVVGAGSLAGCSTATVPPGVAAQVGDQTITIADLQAEVRSLAADSDDPAGFSDDAANIQREILGRTVQFELVRKVAADQGISVSPAEVDEFLDLAAEANGGDLTQFRVQNLYTEDALRVGAEVQLLVQQLQEAGVDLAPEVEALAEEVGVQVNPRFGSWEGFELLPGTGAIAVRDDAEPQPAE